MSIKLRSLSPELAAIAAANWKETPELAYSHIAALKKWIKKSSHLKARTDAQLLLAFLRCCHFRIEETKKRIDSFYALKSVFPEVLGSRQFDESLQLLYRTGVHIILSKPIKHSSVRIVISQFSKMKRRQATPREALKLLFMLLEMLAIEDDNASVCGVAYVIDARDVSVDQMAQCDPQLLRKAWTLIEHCLPLRFSEVHVINMRREGQEVFSHMQSFVPAKLPFKFVVHQKAEDLFEHLPRDAMTVEYGGHNGYQGEALFAWQGKLQQYAAYFANDANYGTSERLRVAWHHRWNRGEMTGLSGSFRKLNMD